MARVMLNSPQIKVDGEALDKCIKSLKEMQTLNRYLILELAKKSGVEDTDAFVEDMKRRIATAEKLKEG